MTQYVTVVGGVVQGVFAGPQNDPAPDGYAVIDDSSAEWQAYLLAQAQAGAVGRLAAQFSTVIAAGRNYGGKNYQIDDASLSKISGAALMAYMAQAASQPYSQSWIATDNTQTPFDAPGMIAFGQDVGAYYSAVVLKNAAVKAAIAALATVSDCDAFDVTQGWPAN